MMKTLRIYFLFHGLLKYFQKKIMKIWGHRSYSFSAGPNLTPPVYFSCIIQYKKFRKDHFGRFDDAILQVYEAI